MQHCDIYFTITFYSFFYILYRQRKLEEALLYCGQFKDALQALLDWLKRTEKELSDEGPVHGDLDTVTALIDQHKVIKCEIYSPFNYMCQFF